MRMSRKRKMSKSRIKIKINNTAKTTRTARATTRRTSPRTWT